MSEYINDPPDDGVPSPVEPIRQPRPELQPWYDDMVQLFTQAQLGTREGHLSLAAAWRAAAANVLIVASEHERIAAAATDEAVRTAHHALAAAWRTAASNLNLIAEAHERLAANVPDMAQAAADLGTSAERHTANNIRAIVRGEQELNIVREHEVSGISKRLTAVEGVLQELKTVLSRALSPDPAYWSEATEMRQKTLEILERISQKIGAD